jgi:hypothetical protein
MMVSGYLVALIVLVVVAVAIFKIVKAVAKAIFIVSVLAFFTLSVMGYVVLMDIRSFNQDFVNQPSVVLLESGGNIVAGFSAKLGSEMSSSYHLISDSDLAFYRMSFDSNDLGSAKKDFYKVFVVHSAALEPMSELDLLGVKANKDDFSAWMNSNSSIDDFINSKVPYENQKAPFKQRLAAELNITSDTGFKDLLFFQATYSLLADKTSSSQQLFLLDNFRKGNIDIFPQTVLFDIIKSVPSGLDYIIVR